MGVMDFLFGLVAIPACFTIDKINTQQKCDEYNREHYEGNYNPYIGQKLNMELQEEYYKNYVVYHKTIKHPKVIINTDYAKYIGYVTDTVRLDYNLDFRDSYVDYMTAVYDFLNDHKKEKYVWDMRYDPCNARGNKYNLRSGRGIEYHPEVIPKEYRDRVDRIL